ncbi:MAG: pilus assembly protein TadG-related protein [bacterium]|nr:pilus assembly protein TadG-related protein [bacterium]
MNGRSEGGAALVITILMLPVLLLSLALVADAGMLMLARQLAHTAADMAALAACQELDPDRLDRGELVLDPARARAVARNYAMDNLRSAFPGIDLTEDVVVTVGVHNPNPSAPGRDQVTGRELLHPTVCVTIDVAVPLRLFPVPGGRVWVWAHADASVVIR